MVKWSPPYRRENVEQQEFDLVEIERDGPVGRIVLNSPEKRNPLGYERLLQIEMAAKLLELDDDTPTDLIMLTKRSINRQFEVMGFRTGIAASVDLLALSSFRQGGLYSRGSRDGRESGDEFLARSQRDGLKAALDWRERTFGNRYRSGEDTSEPEPEDA